LAAAELNAEMVKRSRYAIVTPYYQEERAVLQRCRDSVAAQTLAADHILVADGFPQDWIDGEAARHIRLDSAHGDYGNTARGLGALLAAAEDYDGIGFLDADNWYERDHVARCVATGETGADLVLARRRFVRPDTSPMPMSDDPNHADTSCYWFQPGSYHLLRYWLTMPRGLALIGDRVFYRLVTEQKLSVARVAEVTVNYLCLWESDYRRIGETPPPGAKPNVQLNIAQFLGALSPDRRRVLKRLCGIDLASLLPEKS
jgi:glycosyltransferase involved in cell wall biosynthesis